MKIFGLGLSKTGTTSLTRALEILGYRAAHNGLRFLTETPEQLADLDAATDELWLSYPQLDQRFPGAKFILTVREIESWLKSCSHHFRSQLDPESRVGKMMLELYGTTVFDADKFRAGYERHVAGVRDYFRDRPQDLLVMDFVAGDGWEKLCPFLGKPLPSETVPKENVSRSVSRFTRRVKKLLGRRSTNG